MPDRGPIDENLALRCNVLAFRMQCRVDACLERHGTEKTATESVGVAISYRFAREIATAFAHVAAFLDKEPPDVAYEDTPDPIAAQAMLPAIAARPVATIPRYALVEIFGHRRHYGEIREVEAFGAKLLEVVDVDTGKAHQYGGAAIFSMTLLTEHEFLEHVAAGKREKERQARWDAEYRARREARDADDDSERPF